MISVILLAVIHTAGEVLYKIGGERIVSARAKDVRDFKKFLFPAILASFSIGISAGIKILYGILLGFNPLSLTAGVFLGSVAMFSVLFGAGFFKERLSLVQIIGIILVVTGILLLV